MSAPVPEKRARQRGPDGSPVRQNHTGAGVPQSTLAPTGIYRTRYAPAAACTIARNDAAVSEAPPTSAPSSSGSANSAWALSVLTDPP